MTARSASGHSVSDNDVPPPLRVDNITLRFGGVTALDGVSFTVAPGTIHALIGPNGAGKSSCFNVLSGVYRATAGSIRFGDHELTRLSPHRIARLGISRTFQNIALSGSQTVLGNLMIGRHLLMRASFAGAALWLPHVPREERRHQERVEEIATRLGLAERLHVPVKSLSYGELKRVEIARAIAAEPRLVLLDEPVAGLNGAETAAIASTIASIRDELGISVLLVEHDMSLVMRIADRISVLDFGRLVADDVPEEIRRHPEVTRAYLGTQDHKAPDRERRDPA